MAPRGIVTARDGLLVVDKPAGLTSHDVVGKIRRLAATRKVGHAGTLDPSATGVLVIGVGRATRLLTYLVGNSKTYLATIRFGIETHTDDAEGNIVCAQGIEGQDPEEFSAKLGELAGALRGEIMQVPSSVSAIKIDGVRAHRAVREGTEVKLEARPVTINSLGFLGPVKAARSARGTAVFDVDVHVDCSSGTYVRAIARDLGRAMGCGAHLTALCRTRSGNFTQPKAHSLAHLEQCIEADIAAGSSGRPPSVSSLPVLGLADSLRATLPVLTATKEQVVALRYGQRPPGQTGGPGPHGVIGPDGQAVGIVEGMEKNGAGRLKPIMIFTVEEQEKK